MSDVNVRVLLQAVDRATRPFRAVQEAGKALASDIKSTQNSLKELNAQAGRIENFRKSSAQLAVTARALDKAKQEAAALAVQFRNTQNPTMAQTRAMEAARRAASELQIKHNGLRLSVQRQRQELSAAGINTNALATSERNLRAQITQTTAALNRQREAMARVSQQQARLTTAKQRYQAGRQLAGTVAGAGAAGVGVATAGTMAGVGLLKSGYDFSLKNSELQATLGLEKDSADMNALRHQARELGDNTAASADDAAGAQIIIAKAGGDASAIQAATPVTLNMALSNRRSMEENASLLMGMKSAFQLSNDKVAHIGDVLSMTMNKTAADFNGLSDALTYAAPVAKNAGVSIEETAAMVGALHDAKITGSMAGTGSRAVISRLQAPTSKAYTAIKELGVKTTDSKGNTRPIFSILKEMKASFEKNNLGSGQKAEYMKAIFGEEASSAAAVLMDAATTGKLDQLTNTLRASDGKTEELVKVMQDNLGGDFKEFESAFEAVGSDLFDGQESTLRKLVQTATKYVLKIDQWIKKNPEVAATLLKIVGAGVAIIGVLGAIGLAAWPVIQGVSAIIAAASTLGAVFSFVGPGIVAAIGAISWPVLAVVAVIVGAALLIRKYWEPICAFFKGVGQGLVAAFAPVGDMFKPMAPAFDAIVKALKDAWDWFKKLIEPVESSKESLNKCQSAGETFGRVLGAALLAPLTAFNKMRESVNWLLKTLGVVKSESDDLATSAEQLNHSVSGGASFGSYAPVTAPGGKQFTDNSNNNYQIHVTAGGNPEDVARQVQQQLEAKERARRASLRSQMNGGD